MDVRYILDIYVVLVPFVALLSSRLQARGKGCLLDKDGGRVVLGYGYIDYLG